MICIINITNRIGWRLGYKRDDKKQDVMGAGRADVVDGFVGIGNATCIMYALCVRRLEGIGEGV